MEERYNLAIDRMKAIIEEKTEAEKDKELMLTILQTKNRRKNSSRAISGIFPACGSVYFKA